MELVLLKILCRTDILLEFTKSLRAFANMTEPTRRALCKVMVFAWIEKEGTEVLKDGERVRSCWWIMLSSSFSLFLQCQ